MFESGSDIVNQRGRVWLTAVLRRCRSVSRVIAQTIGTSLFPPRCCLCSFPGESLELDLCAFCRAELPWANSLSNGRFVALHFAHPADDLVRQLKYHGVIANGRVLGVLLAQSVTEQRVPLPKLLIPVPLHIAKQRERGFNQAAALARHAGRLLDIPVARAAVVRVRNTPSQTSLDVAARHRNVLGAFEINGERQTSRLLDAEHVAIVDDVITTGSTVNELRRVLLAAGVRRVDVWAVAQAS
jgi:ComF family protein